MKRIASVIVMQARDWRTWLVGPGIVLGATFVICLLIALCIDVLWKGSIPVYTGAVACLAVVMLAVAIGTVGGTFPFAVGFGRRRSDYLLGTLAWSVAYCACWAVLLGLLSLIEASVIKNWGVGLHFFHLPILSYGSPLRQFCWLSPLTICPAHTQTPTMSGVARPCSSCGSPSSSCCSCTCWDSCSAASTSALAARGSFSSLASSSCSSTSLCC